MSAWKRVWTVESAVVIAGAAFVALLTFAFERRARVLDEKRVRFAQALADVQRWIELPFRIRRRQAGASARHQLASDISSLQESIALHLSWVQIEDARVHRSYQLLVAAARETARPRMQEAWNTAPASQDSDMNLAMPFDIDDLSDAKSDYVKAVRDHLALWKLWKWR